MKDALQIEFPSLFFKFNSISEIVFTSNRWLVTSI